MQVKPANLKVKLSKVIPEHRWLAEPVTSNGSLALVTCQISDRKHCTIAGVFEIELPLGARWAVWKVTGRTTMMPSARSAAILIASTVPKRFFLSPSEPVRTFVCLD
ncbi:hypothetical protein IFO70_27730 [Phormidium tenue FACHB-886]|nr:hypothetical protein [Phormidium tenue FACHB-886]